MDTLIIAASLVNPPTETLAFRTITMFSASKFKLNNLIEVDRELVDFYYKHMKRMGTFDYIKDIVTPLDRENGIRLDTEYNYPLTVVADKITFNNIYNLLGQLQSLNGIARNNSSDSFSF